MNTSTDCENVRIALMASLDGENDLRSAQDRSHLSTCASCQRWLKDLESLNGRLQDLSYRNAQADLWSGVEGRIRHSGQRLALPSGLWAFGATMLGWRALQLFVDLPVPVLHAVVLLAAAAALVWLVAADPLAIETSAPELQKGGV